MDDHMQLVEEKNEAYGLKEPDYTQSPPLWRELGDYFETSVFGYQVPLKNVKSKKRKTRE